jgi:hypothetical protein
MMLLSHASRNTKRNMYVPIGPARTEDHDPIEFDYLKLVPGKYRIDAE